MKQLLLFIFLTVMSFQSLLFGQCITQNLDNKSYQFCLNSKNWYEAQNDCASKNMSLLSNITFAKHYFIMSEIQNMLIPESFWIGLNDFEAENIWVWSNGTELLQSDETFWEENQPDNSNEEDCVEMRSEFNYKWNDNNCLTLNYYICEGELITDNDRDGFPAEVDCDDTNSLINPDAVEMCNGIDDNCNVEIDENCIPDNDNDGFIAGVDCDDNNPYINPGMPEFCNYIDDNCDNQIDENCIYTDDDADGFPAGDDCDDNNPYINPAAVEICNDVDDNCNNQVDDNCITDSDSDGFSDEVDNCPNVINNQSDIDGDNIGDVCDDDNDNDNVLDTNDNCVYIANENQLDTDNDKIGDLCDNCVSVKNPDQKNEDGGFIPTEIIQATQYFPFNFVYDIEIDNENNIYLSDASIQGVGKLHVNDNIWTAVPIMNPRSIEIYNNEIYVVDNDSKTIQVFNTSLELLRTIPVDLGDADIINMVVKYDEIYISSSDRVKVLDLSENLIKNFTVIGNISTAFDVDSQKNIYYVDSITNEVIKRTNDGILISKFGGIGNNNGKFSVPFSLKIDSGDNIYISDRGLLNIQKFTKNGDFIEKYDVNYLNNGFSAFELTSKGFYIAENRLIVNAVIGDKLGDVCDNCINVPNQDQANTDRDEFGDICDSNYCSENQPLGQCYESAICDNGVCVNALYSCSSSHTDGYCEAGKVCREGTCVNKIELCSVEFPMGYCLNNKVCDDGICVDKINYCSSEHIDGYCESGKFCDGGVCVDKVYACSPAHLDGLCQTGYECKEGVCVILSDNNNSSGSDDGCSFSSFTQKSGEHTGSPLHGISEGIMLLMMVIGLLIKRKYN